MSSSTATTDPEAGLVQSLWVVAGILGVLSMVGLSPSVPRTGSRTSSGKEAGGGLIAGLDVVKKSAYLGKLVGIIALTQFAITAVDFDFKLAVEGQILNPNVRQGFFADVYSVINLLGLGLSLGAGVIMTLLGLRKTLLGIPVLFGVVVCGALLTLGLPIAFWCLVVAKVASKSMDYSIFRAAKEQLYLPLSLPEKTEGKAVVDVMTYRVAKGLASAVLLFLGAIAAPVGVATGLSIGAVIVWALWTRPVLDRFERLSGKTPASG